MVGQPLSLFEQREPVMSFSTSNKNSNKHKNNSNSCIIEDIQRQRLHWDGSVLRTIWTYRRRRCFFWPSSLQSTLESLVSVCVAYLFTGNAIAVSIGWMKREREDRIDFMYFTAEQLYCGRNVSFACIIIRGGERRLRRRERSPAHTGWKEQNQRLRPLGPNKRCIIVRTEGREKENYNRKSLTKFQCAQWHTKPYDKISRSHVALGVEHGDQLHRVLFVCHRTHGPLWNSKLHCHCLPVFH